MKRLLGKWSLCLMLALMGGASLSAQSDPTAGEVDLFGSQDPISVIILQEASGGTLEEQSDGSYQLNLEGLPSQASLLQVSPPSALVYDTASFFTDWLNALASDQNLSIYAELRLDDALLIFSLNSAQYDALTGTVRYTGTLDSAIPSLAGISPDQALEDIKYMPPSRFGAATLSLNASQSFWGALEQASIARLQNLRDATSVMCANAKQRLNDLITEYRSTPNPSLRANIRRLQEWLAINCK